MDQFAEHIEVKLIILKELLGFHMSFQSFKAIATPIISSEISELQMFPNTMATFLKAIN